MNLASSLMGLRLPHPFVAGASPLGRDLDTVRRLEDGGAAAIVLPSLFEEQITHGGRRPHPARRSARRTIRGRAQALPGRRPTTRTRRTSTRSTCRPREGRREHPRHRLAQRHHGRIVAHVLAPDRAGRRRRDRAEHVRSRSPTSAISGAAVEHQLVQRDRRPEALSEDPDRGKAVAILRVRRATSPAAWIRPAPTRSCCSTASTSRTSTSTTMTASPHVAALDQRRAAAAAAVARDPARAGAAVAGRERRRRDARGRRSRPSSRAPTRCRSCRPSCATARRTSPFSVPASRSGWRATRSRTSTMCAAAPA